MQSTSTLVLEVVPGNVSDRPRAVRFEACVGDEIIDFEPAVFLEGKVRLSNRRTHKRLATMTVLVKGLCLAGATGGVRFPWPFVAFGSFCPCLSITCAFRMSTVYMCGV